MPEAEAAVPVLPLLPCGLAPLRVSGSTPALLLFVFASLGLLCSFLPLVLLLLLLLILLVLFLWLPEEAVCCETATAGGVPTAAGIAGLLLAPPPPFSGDFLSPPPTAPTASNSVAVGPAAGPLVAADSLRLSSFLIASPGSAAAAGGAGATETGPLLLSSSDFTVDGATAGTFGDVRSSVVGAAVGAPAGLAVRPGGDTFPLIRLELSSSGCWCCCGRGVAPPDTSGTAPALLVKADGGVAEAA